MDTGEKPTRPDDDSHTLVAHLRFHIHAQTAPIHGLPDTLPGPARLRACHIDTGCGCTYLRYRPDPALEGPTRR